jgi:replicative DNA helicase
MFNSAKELIRTIGINREIVDGIPTGFERFDQMTGGLHKNELLLLSASRRMGRTTLALSIANNLLARNIPVAVFTPGMGRQDVVERMHAASIPLNLRQLRAGLLSKDNFAKLTARLAGLAASPLWLDDSVTVSCETIFTQTSALYSQLHKAKQTLGLLIIDDVQLILTDNKLRINKILFELKKLAIRLNIPVLATVRLPDPPKNDLGMQPPMIYDLREAGISDEHTDTVAFFYRPEYFSREDTSLRGMANIIIAKQAKGPLGWVHLNFEHEYVRLVNPSKIK